MLILKFMKRYPRGLFIKPQLQSQRNEVGIKVTKGSFLNVFLKANDTEFFSAYVTDIIITLYELLIMASDCYLGLILFKNSIMIKVLITKNKTNQSNQPWHIFIGYLQYF